MSKLLPFLFFLISINVFSQKYNNLAPTPPMGWNSWNKFACNVNEELIMEIADAMVEMGLKDAGYKYVIIDDCWQGERDSMGFIEANLTHFPSGIKALADYVHDCGLKFGIYSCAGDKTCANRPGSRGYEYQDALTFARWGVDYLKYDWCNTDNLNAEEAYKTMRNALKKAGRPILFSLCEWGDNEPWVWGEEVGHMWRTTGDIYNCFDCEYNHGSWSSWGVMRIADMQNNLREFSGPDHWNDPDMLEVGNGMSNTKDRAHFSIWCMIAAPLIAGNDLRNMSDETLAILTNKHAIKVNQDPLGIQGFRFEVKDSIETWVKPLINNKIAFCFLNRSSKNKKIKINWDDIVINDSISGLKVDFNKEIYKYINVWNEEEKPGTTKKSLNLELEAFDVFFIILNKYSF
jgi:alpha-galactosidase